MSCGMFWGAYLDDFSVFESWLFSDEEWASDGLVTEEGAQWLFGCVFVSLDTLLARSISSVCNLSHGGSFFLNYRKQFSSQELMRGNQSLGHILGDCRVLALKSSLILFLCVELDRESKN